MGKQFVIIFKIMVLMFQKIGRINNIEILRKMKMDKQRLCKQLSKVVVQIKMIITIQLLKMIMVIPLHFYWLKME